MKFLFLSFPIATVLLVVSFFYFYKHQIYIEPKHIINYYSAAINKIGAPEGFTINPSRDETQDSPFDNMSVRRTYDGTGIKQQVQNEMLQRVKNAGFTNAEFEGDTIKATCEGTGIYIYLYQQGDDPIDIQVAQANWPDSPPCPNL